MSASLGVRDRNEASWTQIMKIIGYMVDSVSAPVVTDGDAGFGDFNNAGRPAWKSYRRGVAGGRLKNQTFPRTNSFLGPDQPPAPMGEFRCKIKAAKDSQSNGVFCVAVRVEALVSRRSTDEALWRSEARHAAGADTNLICSKESSADEVPQIIGRWDGFSPVIIGPAMYRATPADLFRKGGISAVIGANHALRAAISATRSIIGRIRKNRSVLEVNGDMVSVAEAFRPTNVDELEMAEKIYAEPARTLPSIADGKLRKVRR
ncbi:MAG TPA: isocitrate lyase/phosphoenolpyruvate mutase family protein [Stellaceae bacterium]|nr:isocitrate lyase/phosphoenolpyruvate mutase family protein [Stellaceae bacterium]